MSADEPSADALALLAWAGIPWQGHPIGTGLAMCKPTLKRYGAWHSPRLPDLTEYTPAVWDRPLELAEASRAYVHLIDRHAAYLVACASLELGCGDPQHHRRPTFARSVPGYWRVEASPEPWPLGLPDPLGRDVRARASVRERIARERWLSTPTLALAIEQGVELEIAEAWLWDRHKRVLRPFYEACLRARTALDAVLARQPTERRRLAAIEAVGTLKAIYQATLGGGFAMLKDRRRDPRPPWYRPDFKAAVIAEMRANLIRNLARWSTVGVHAAAIYNDGAYVLTDEASPPAGPRYGEGLAGFSYKGRWPAAALIEHGRVVPSLAWGEHAPRG